MTKSGLCSYVNITGNHNSGRGGNRVCKITPHYMAAHWTGKQCADYFAGTSRQASSNYCIGYDGDIAMSVDENDRAWTSSSGWNDRQAITIECANNSDSSLSDATYSSLVKLCADICQRYGIAPSYDGTQNATFTEHRMFAATDCPGAWLHGHMAQLVADVKATMGGGTVSGGGSDSGALDVDGYWGYATTKRAQTVAGTPVDGEIWGQNPDHQWRMPGCTQGWKFTDCSGSAFIRHLQGVLGVDADGIVGPDTINAFIKRYGNGVTDGKLDAPSIAIKGFQQKLNAGQL